VSDVLNQDLPGQTELRDQYSFGAQLQWTLFDGGAARAAARQEEINTAIAETQFADTRNQVRFAVEQAYYTLQANYENISTANLALEQARESLRLARLRFQAGVGTQSDVLRSQTELTRAETNLVGAILGYNRSLVSLRRAISNFPDGILSDLP
jgi:outer membrane protein TolC